LLIIPQEPTSYLLIIVKGAKITNVSGQGF